MSQEERTQPRVTGRVEETRHLIQPSVPTDLLHPPAQPRRLCVLIVINFEQLKIVASCQFLM